MNDTINATQAEYIRTVGEYRKAAIVLNDLRGHLSSGGKEARKAFDNALSLVVDRQYAMNRAETEHYMALQAFAENQLS